MDYRHQQRRPSVSSTSWGVFVPFRMEEKIVKMVQYLRERKLPVFRDDILEWCSALIEGTPYANIFKDGVASKG